LKGAAARSGTAGLKTWSAGCSIGVEAYTMGMLLDEKARFRKHTILATDLDRSALLKARARGPYVKEEGRNLLREQRQRYLDECDDGSFFVKESLAKLVTFCEHDLLQDRFETGFDLIVCRNVVIYFTNEAKSTLYARFAGALRSGGVLFLGGTEIIPRPAEYGLRSTAVSFYQKE
ncbi:MAG TPA: CheR family methyltransferase, partial [Anaerolineaceae bacterium]|nr:CheR family methyltransferase [Anaerolineaceae bacterium]